ncbi:hypothetical protein PC9H_008524 [Pleurotus ostreatus]|uniref:Uncharacterized protein n=1 Tax=Pleurotus ostreatus TaxID=5322 RepID=A0A8H6ZNY0_PLEOS|nr:uncharacterized protein PC9H_008524 [Pleurotus ostreatus]KAF7426158.1 hypothetical protein PC9H_008524 [Pleurotus ostreatus]
MNIIEHLVRGSPCLVIYGLLTSAWKKLHSSSESTIHNIPEHPAETTEKLDNITLIKVGALTGKASGRMPLCARPENPAFII